MARKYIQMGKTTAENVTAINDNFSELYEARTSIYDDVEQLQTEVAQLQSDMTAVHTWQTSVDDVLYDSGWINLTLNTGWTCQYNTDIAQYRKIGNVVYLRGLLNATQAAGQVIGTLPEGFIPSGHFERFVCPHQQGGTVNIEVGFTGQLKDYTKTTSAGREFISLYGISFVV